MAPEMAVSYVIGWIPSAVTTGLQIWFHRKKVKSLAYQQLQNNLKKIDLMWSESTSDIEPFIEGKEEEALKSYEKSILLMGALFLLLSWLGFFFNLAVLLSVHFLAVSRREQKIFSSSLSIKDVDKMEVALILKETE
jgi:hypothetical protein